MSEQTATDYPRIIQIQVSCLAGEEPQVRERATRNVGPGSFPDSWALEVSSGRGWKSLNLGMRHIGEASLGPRPSSGHGRAYEGGIWCFEEDRGEMTRCLLEELADCIQKDLDDLRQSMDHIAQMVEPTTPHP